MRFPPVLIALVALCKLACGETSGVDPRDGGLALDVAVGLDALDDLDAGTSTAPDAATSLADAGTCSDYCACMALRCATYDGYPFAGEAQCLAGCASFNGEQLTCWARFCRLVRLSRPEDRAHNCEHAWGLHDLEECL